MKPVEQAHFTYFQNTACEFFPCHETEHPENFSCLFCYCPLYALGRRCGGNYRYLENGVKDCSDCLIPHRKENFAYITARFEEIAEIVKENDQR